MSVKGEFFVTISSPIQLEESSIMPEIYKQLLQDLDTAINNPKRVSGPISTRGERIKQSTLTALDNEQFIQGKLVITGGQLAEPFEKAGLVNPRNSASSAVTSINKNLEEVGSDWKLVPIRGAIYIWKQKENPNQ